MAGMELSANFALLVQLVDHPADPAKIRATAEQPDVNWEALGQLARRHRVTRRAAMALSKAGLAVPDDLAATSAAKARSAMAQVAEAQRVRSALETHGIRSVVLKGVVLSQTLYGDPTLRESKDIDLLIAREQFSAALKALSSDLDYTCPASPPVDTDRFDLWLDGNKDTSLVAPSGIQLELHHRLTAARDLLPGVGIEQATEHVTIGNKPFAQFDPASLFAYLSVHGAASRWHRLTWLADIRAMMAGSDAETLIAWHDNAVRLGVERCTLSAMMLCERLWGGAIPDHIRTAADADTNVAKIVANSLSTLTDPDILPVTARGRGYVSNALLLRDSWAYRSSVVKEITLDPDLLGDIAVPHRWRYLYVPLRALQWIKRKLGKLLS